MVLILSFLLGGVAGILSVLIAQLLMFFSLKFGRNKTPHLGGVVIVSFFTLSQMWFVLSDGIMDMSVVIKTISFASLILFFFGLYEEILGALSLRHFLGLILFFFSGLVLLNKSLLIQVSMLPFGGKFFAENVTAVYVLTVLILTHFVFAMKLLGGSFGLATFVNVLVFIGLIQLGLGEVGHLLSLVAVGCVLLLLFNFTIGSINIGAGGTYFLGCIAGLVFISVINAQVVDPWYLMCLLFYPNANAVFLLIKPVLSSRFAFVKKINGLHGLFELRLLGVASLRKQADSLSFVIIGMVFAGLPLLAGNSGLDVPWMNFYILMWCVYIAFWVIFTRFDSFNG